MATTGHGKPVLGATDGHGVPVLDGLVTGYGVPVLGGASAPPAVTPTVSTSAASSVSFTSARLNGNLTNLGDFETVNVYFEWRVVGAGSWETTASQEKTATGTFYADLSGLDDDEDFEFRAVVEWSDGETQTDTGSTLEFSTEAYVDPSATTSAATSVTSVSATLNGSVDVGNYVESVTAYFRYGQVGDATETTEPQVVTESGSVSAAIAGLSPEVDYEFFLVVEWEVGEDTLLAGGETLGIETLSPSFGITIGGVAIGGLSTMPHRLNGSFRLALRSDHRNTCDLTVVTTANVFLPRAGQEMIVTQDGAVWFGGIIKTGGRDKIANEFGGNTLLEVLVSSDGYHSIPARRTIAAEYGEPVYCGQLVQDFITNHLAAEGITAGTIDDGALLPNYRKTVNGKAALDEWADTSGVKWWIDDSKQLHFTQEEELTDAPYSLIEGGEFRDYVLGKVEESLEGYRNKQFVVGGSYTPVEGEAVGTGNGSGTEFTLDLAPVAPNSETLYLDASPTTAYAIDYETGVVTFDSPPGAGVAVTADYRQIGGDSPVQLTRFKQVDSEVAERQALEGGSGVYGNVYEDSNIYTDEAADAVIDNLLKRQGTVRVTLPFSSSYLGWRPATRLAVGLPAVGLGTGQLPEESSPAVPIGWDSVATASDVNAMRNNLTRNYALAASPDMSSYASNEGFQPIGTAADPFRGQLDGRGHVIRNLTINRPSEDCVGLFGAYDYGGVWSGGPDNRGGLRSVRLRDANIVGREWTGALVGKMPALGAVPHFNIDRCSVTGTVTGDKYVGGVYGGYPSPSTASATLNYLYRTWFHGDVYGTKHVGGIVGYTTRLSKELCCYARGSVKASVENCTGGIHGFVRYGYLSGQPINVEYCYAAVEMDPDDTHPHTASNSYVINKDKDGIVSSDNGSSGYGTPSRASWFDYELTLLSAPYVRHAGGGIPAPTYNMTTPGYVYPYLSPPSGPQYWQTYIYSWPWGIWAIDPAINDGYPYLVDNMPDQEEEESWLKYFLVEDVNVSDQGNEDFHAFVRATLRGGSVFSTQRTPNWVDGFKDLKRR